MNTFERMAAFEAKAAAFKKAEERLQRIQFGVLVMWIIGCIVMMGVVWFVGLTTKTLALTMVGVIVSRWFTHFIVNRFVVDPMLEQIRREHPISPREES